MKCFYSNQDAIGICKSCNRGLSKDFAVEYPQGLACKNRCEKDVVDLISLVTRSISTANTSTSLIKGSGSAHIAGGFFKLFMGLCFLTYGIISGSFDLGIYIGIGFIVYAGYGFWRGLQLNNTNKKNAEQGAALNSHSPGA